MKKDEIYNNKYPSELEKRIADKYEKVINNEFSSLQLNEEEANDLKRTLKFVLSENSMDSFTKKFAINRIRKCLLSHDEKERIKANVMLHILHDMRRDSLVSAIKLWMKMSLGVKEQILQEPTIELQKEKQTVLENLLLTVDNNIGSLNNIKQQIDKSQYNIDDLRISMSGEAVDYILRLSDVSQHRDVSKNASPTPSKHNFKIFIYVGDLETKLEKVTMNTWQSKLSKADKEIVCFYMSSESDSPILSQSANGFTCKTLKEVLANVKNKRSAKRSS